MKRQIWGIICIFCIGIFAVCGAEVNAEARIVGAEEEMTMMPGDGEARMLAVGAGQVADNAERIEMSAEGATNLSVSAYPFGQSRPSPPPRQCVMFRRDAETNSKPHARNARAVDKLAAKAS